MEPPRSAFGLLRHPWLSQASTPPHREGPSRRYTVRLIGTALPAAAPFAVAELRSVLRNQTRHNGVSCKESHFSARKPHLSCRSGRKLLQDAYEVATHA